MALEGFLKVKKITELDKKFAADKCYICSNQLKDSEKRSSRFDSDQMCDSCRQLNNLTRPL